VTSSIPAELVAGSRFVAPPGWEVPAGFDPRLGHLPDPTWPAAPTGWAFWVAPTPPGKTAGFVAKVGATRLVIGGILAAIAVMLVLGQIFDDSPEADGVGSCWAEGTSSVESVPCGSSAAAYRVTKVASSSDACDGPEGYLSDGTQFLCLEAVD
jgi:hypothetical protein